MLRIDVWSDIVCPWCYIGKRRLERALAEFEHRDEVQIVHHSFQLNPQMPLGTTTPRREMLKKKYQLSDDQVVTMDERLERLAAEDGLDYDLSGGVTGNTLDAHRLVHYAAKMGRQDEMVERLYRAYFTEQQSIFDHDSLADLASEVGLDAADVRKMLGSSDYAAEVKADHAEATALGARGVPFFVLDARYGVSGAQPVEAFAEALRRAWNAAHTAA